MKQEQKGMLSNVMRTIAGVALGLACWPASASADLNHPAASAYPAGDRLSGIGTGQRNSTSQQGGARLHVPVMVGKAPVASLPAGYADVLTDADWQPRLALPADATRVAVQRHLRPAMPDDAVAAAGAARVLPSTETYLKPLAPGPASPVMAGWGDAPDYALLPRESTVPLRRRNGKWHGTLRRKPGLPPGRLPAARKAVPSLPVGMTRRKQPLAMV